MESFEYRVVPAPKRGKRGRGVKGPEARFAHALEAIMNDMASEGWEYLRMDTLPAEERTGLTSKVTVFQNMLVFRREKTAETTATPEPLPLPAPEPVRPALTVVEDATWDEDEEIFTVDILRDRAARLKRPPHAAE